MGYSRKRRDGDPAVAILNMIKRLMQWAHYRGGIGLVFMMIGAFVMCAALLWNVIGMPMNYPVLYIASGITIFGLILSLLKKLLF